MDPTFTETIAPPVEGATETLLGSWLRQSRRLLGYTLQQTAQREPALNPSSLSKLERGETTKIRRQTLDLIAPAYGPPWWPETQSRTWLAGLVWVWTQRSAFLIGQAETDHIRLTFDACWPSAAKWWTH